MSTRINHQEIVKKALDSKVVDFDAIGKMVAELGPSLSLAEEPGDNFCGTGRNFFHIYKIPFSPHIPIENLAGLKEIASGALKR